MNRTFVIFAACALGQALAQPAAARVDPLIILPGHVVTSTQFHAAPDAPRLTPTTGDDIPIVERVPEGRGCRPIGSLTTVARMFDILTARPTHADVDGALRRVGMRNGADMLTDVRYVTQRQGLVAGGKIRGFATALSCRA